MEKFANFMSQIPEPIVQNVKAHIGTDLALFKPQTILEGITLHSVDFHIILLAEPPPDSYVNDKLQSFQYGKIIVVNPGDTWLCPRGHSTKQYLSLLIKPDLVNKIAEEMGLSGNVQFLQLQNPFSSEMLQTIKNFDKESTRSDCFPLMMDSLGVQIVALLLREFKTNLRKYPVHSPDSDAYINLAMEYMHTFFSANISIEDICQEINVSPFHFIRTFKQKTGFSPHQYLLKVRMKKAQELLQRRQHSVAEVAMLCGFVNLSHFSSKFKELTGHSPSSYKKIFSYQNSNF